MCVPFDLSEYLHGFPIGRYYRQGRLREAVVPILAKKVYRRSGGQHISTWGLEYVPHTFIHDPRALYRDHDRNIHLAPNAFAATRLEGYGDHVILVIPHQQLWGKIWKDQRVCYHTMGGYVLECLTCSGYELKEVSSREFWESEVPSGFDEMVEDAVRQGAFVGEIPLGAQPMFLPLPPDNLYRFVPTLDFGLREYEERKLSQINSPYNNEFSAYLELKEILKKLERNEWRKRYLL